MAKKQGSGLRVAVVGATGLVGRELLNVLEKRRFPVAELFPFSSGSTRASVRFRGRAVPAPGVSAARLKAADLIFLVSSDDVARRYAPALAKSGIWVIDDSSAFRLDPSVPLVLPEVNGDALRRDRRLIAGPNCTLTGAAVAGIALAQAAGARAVRIASYQAVSGAGRAALEEFLDQSRRARRGSTDPGELLSRRPAALKPRALPRAISMNVFPQVGSFDRRGDSSEEFKVAHELRKIWNLPRLPVSVTAVRVPVLRGHSLAVWLETRRPLSAALARRILGKAPGVRLWREGTYPTPREIHGTWPVHVGRVRQGTSPRELCLWIVSDNLLKGAALNSVQIAEELLRRGWLSTHGKEFVKHSF